MSKAMMYREPLERYFLNKLVAEYPGVLHVNDLQIRVFPSESSERFNWTVREISPDLPEDLRAKVWSLVAKLQQEIDIYLDEPPADHHIG
jgi:hypothetical protein